MKFKMFAASQLGTKYAAKNWNCQDSSGAVEFDNIQVIAVADGHGGSDYFRSEIGSKLAVEVLFNQIKIFCKDLNSAERFSENGIKNFKFNFVNEWRKAVKNHWDECLTDGKKIGEGEIRYESVSDKYKARYTSDDAEKYLYAAYGTTLICAISTGAEILILQIGDGTCVLLQRNGDFRLPIAPDDENFLNVTVSLCDNHAETKIRHAVINCENDSPNFPAAIFLSTDGLDDSFPYYKNEEHLYKFYADVLIDTMIKEGIAETENEIKNNLLEGISKKASQDDISIAYFLTDFETLKKTFAEIDLRYRPSSVVEEKVEKVEESEKPLTVLPGFANSTQVALLPHNDENLKDVP